MLTPALCILVILLHLQNADRIYSQVDINPALTTKNLVKLD